MGADPLEQARSLLARVASLGGAVEPLMAELAQSLKSVVARAEQGELERASLQQQEAALRTVISSVPFFVFWKDRDAVYRGCNDMFASLAGLASPAEIVGKTDYEMPWTREQAEQYREFDLAVIRSGQPVLNLEETILDADADEKVLLTSKVPLQAEDGSIIGVVGIFADISARKRMEKDLSYAKELAEAANQAKGDFLAAMSHELRTPLTLILSPLESLLSRSQESSPETRRVLTQVHRNASRLKTLTDEILDFSKHQAGHLRLKPEVVKLSEHVLLLVSDMQPAADASGIQLRSDGIQSDIGAVSIDIGKLDKILINLVGNALKFTPPRGQVAVSLQVIGQELALAVSDTGIGIDPSQHDRLFRRFEQLDNGSKRRHGGTGLGLSLVKAFAELMGGSVSVQSALGKGSTFRVALPLERAPELAAPRGAQASRQWLGSLPVADAPVPAGLGFGASEAGRPRVLLAEDNEELRSYVETMLAVHFQVVAVGDGATAYELIARERPDVVVSDVMMPEMDGFELVAKLKADPELSRIPVLLMTARASAEASADGLNRGADDYLAKPFSVIDLIARVRAAYRMRQLNSQLLEAERRVAASERLAALGRLLAKLSHELNNPVNVIYNGITPLEDYSRALLRYATACDESAAARGDTSLAPLRSSLDLDFIQQDFPDAMRAVRDASMRVMDVQANLILFLQGSRALNLAEGEIGTLVASTLDLTRRAVRGRLSAELFIGEVPPFAFDAGRLGQALLNLLKNAAEAAGPTGAIRVATTCTGSHAQIAVSDTGPGVPKAVRSRLFEPFFTTKDVGVGTGLGLAISLEVVSQHGGRLFLDESYRDGARFVIELPLSSVSEVDARSRPVLACPSSKEAVA